MVSAQSSCLTGALGCLGINLLLGVIAVVIFDGHFNMNVLGALLVLAIGGGLGLVWHDAYSRGRQAGESEMKERLAQWEDNPSEVISPDTPKRPRKFVSPWDSAAPDTVSNALAELIEKCFPRVHAQTRFHDRGASSTIRSPHPRSNPEIQVDASDEEDRVTVRLLDDLGEIYSPTGPWRSPGDENGNLSQVFRFIESIISEDVVHTVTPAGEHRLIHTTDKAKWVAQNPRGRIRSWRGTHDQDPLERSPAPDPS